MNILNFLGFLAFYWYFWFGKNNINNNFNIGRKLSNQYHAVNTHKILRTKH